MSVQKELNSDFESEDDSTDENKDNSNDNSTDEFDLTYSTIPSQDKIEQLKEVYDKDSEEEIYDDPFILREEWNMAKDTIHTIIKNTVGEKVEVSGSNLGWRNTEGKSITMKYDEVVDSVKSDRDFSLYVEKLDERVVIKKTDHDSPTLSQANRYYVSPQ